MERMYIRFGEVPEDEHSRAYRNGEFLIGVLDGVSVYDCTQDTHQIVVPSMNGDTVSTLYTFAEYDHRKVYLVTGDKVGIGTDGEPLIRNVKIVNELKDFWKRQKVKEVELE